MIVPVEPSFLNNAHQNVITQFSPFWVFWIMFLTCALMKVVKEDENWKYAGRGRLCSCTKSDTPVNCQRRKGPFRRDRNEPSRITNSGPNEQDRSCLSNDSFYGKFFRAAGWTKVSQYWGFLQNSPLTEMRENQTPGPRSWPAEQVFPFWTRMGETHKQPHFGLGFRKLEKKLQWLMSQHSKMC